MSENILRVVYYNRYDLSSSGIYEFKTSKNKDINDIWKCYVEDGYADSDKTKPISFIEYLNNDKKYERRGKNDE